MLQMWLGDEGWLPVHQDPDARGQLANRVTIFKKVVSHHANAVTCLSRWGSWLDHPNGVMDPHVSPRF